ncbi:MAG: cytochrome c3 family protein [Deltaproteobacteria bacterium]|nr:cytochrome c3 family protein [Deltaproteobacteria bacterium]
MKKGLAIIVVIAAFLFSLGLMAWVYAADKAADSFKIDNDKTFFKDGKRTKPPVEFTHLKHEKDHKIACTECHHVYKDGKNTWKQGAKVQKCNECHKAADQGKILSLQNAFHKNCKDCHTKLKTEGKKTGPTLCAQCHVVAKK